MPRFPRWLPSDCDQEKFLLSRQDLYLKAVDEGKTKEFFAETIAIWAPQFSWTRPPGSPADPSIPVEIEALMQYYDIPEEQRSEFEEWQMASLDDERQKIMNFYKNHVAKPARNAARDQGIILSRSSSPQPLGPFGPIRLKGENHRRKALTKSHRTDKDTFARLFPERVDNAMAETTYTRNNFLATRSRIAQSLLNNASEAEKLQTTVETERLRADDKVKQELLATPQANAIYATALPSQLKDELNALASRTGFIFTLFCGGYDEDGEPIAYVVEAGTLGKAIPTTFGTYIGAEVRNSILDRLRKFMENRNSPDMNVSSSPRNIPTTTPLPILVSSTELQRTSAPDVLVTTHDCTISDSVDAAAVRADSPAQSIDAPGGLLTGISSFESLSSSGTDDSTRVAMSSYTGPNSGATSPTELQDGSGLGSDIRSPVEPQEISAVTPTPTISTTAQNDIDRLEAESRAPDASDTEPNEASTARSGKLPQILSSTLSIPAANDSATGISHPKILLKLNLKTTSLKRKSTEDREEGTKYSRSSLPTSLPEWVLIQAESFIVLDSSDEWNCLVILWCKFEKSKSNLDQDGYLSAKKRPKGIGEWIKNRRSCTWKVPVKSAAHFGVDWNGWWYFIQPESRKSPSTNELQRPPGWRDASSILVPGQNGFLNVVKGLAVWRQNLSKAESRSAWNSAVEDVLWVLRHAGSS